MNSKMNRRKKLKAMEISQLFLDSIGDIKDKIVPIILESSAASEFDADENDNALAWAIAEYLNHLAKNPDRQGFLNPAQDDD